MKNFIIKLFFRKKNLVDEKSNMKLIWLHIIDTTKKS